MGRGAAAPDSEEYVFHPTPRFVAELWRTHQEYKPTPVVVNGAVCESRWAAFHAVQSVCASRGGLASLAFSALAHYAATLLRDLQIATRLNLETAAGERTKCDESALCVLELARQGSCPGQFCLCRQG